MSLRDELLGIRSQCGQLTPDAVVVAATPADHPLHHLFQWDDAVAGHRYRLEQARQLIRVVRETFVPADGAQPERIRVFHAVPGPQGGMVYRPGAEVAADDEAAKWLLASMEREWRALRRRYQRFTQFRDLVLRDLGGQAALAMRHGVARHGGAMRGSAGTARLGSAWQGEAWQGGAGTARLGRSWRGAARLGMARQGTARQARRGGARRGKAGPGVVGQARQG